MKRITVASVLLALISVASLFIVKGVEARQKASYAILFDVCDMSSQTSGQDMVLLGNPRCTGGTSLNIPFEPALPMPSPGTLANLHGQYGGSSDTFTYSAVFTVYVNGTATSLTCTVPNHSTSQCSDDTDEVTVSEGDQVGVQVHLSVSPGTWHSVSVSMEKQ